jgi:hypothetical protein
VLAAFPASQTTFDPPIWPFFSSLRPTPPPDDASTLQPPRSGRPWSQSVDHPEDFLEQFLRHGNLGDPEDDVAAARADEAIESNVESLLLAPLRHANAPRECPLIGADRKWPAGGQNGAFDPERS